MISFNLPDPVEQERTRRGPHTYQAEAGVHGRYIPTAGGVPVKDPKRDVAYYVHQEYPKVMDKTPCPQLKHFGKRADDLTIVLLDEAHKEWDRKQMASIVNNKTEEDRWLAEHANDPILTPGAYPKTMDRTPAPRANECEGLEDYREKRTAWRQQITDSIVHDEVEEQLWLEEHKVPAAKKVLAEHAALAKKKARKPRKQQAAAA